MVLGIGLGILSSMANATLAVLKMARHGSGVSSYGLILGNGVGILSSMASAALRCIHVLEIGVRILSSMANATLSSYSGKCNAL